jgi:signal transduction histidine kinase
MKLDFSKLLDNSQDAFVLLKGDDELVYTNQKAQALLADAGTSLLRAAGNDIEWPKRSREVAVMQPDGAQRVFRIEVIQTYSHEEPLSLLLIRDVTREKRASEDDNARSRQETLNHLKNELISVVSHEMRTPLAIVKSSIETLHLCAAGGLQEKQAKITDTALRNVDRLAKLIDDFLDLSRLESGVTKIRRHKTDTRELIEKCAAESTEAAAAQGLSYSVEIPDAMPTILADPGLFAKSLKHVLHNALRYARSSVAIRAVTEGLFVKITVADDGPGIPKEKLDGLFEKFTQHGRPAGGAGYMGTGLGLTLANEIMELHQGEIAIGSKESVGTEVHLLVPRFDANTVLERELDEARHRADADKASFSLLTVSLHNFSRIRSECSDKDIEWTLGDLAKSIHRMLRADDRVLSGVAEDAVQVLLMGSDRKEAMLVGERIRRVAKGCFCPGRQGRIFIQVSIGIATYPDDTADLDELTKSSFEASRKNLPIH